MFDGSVFLICLKLGFFVCTEQFFACSFLFYAGTAFTHLYGLAWVFLPPRLQPFDCQYVIGTNTLFSCKILANYLCLPCTYGKCPLPPLPPPDQQSKFSYREMMYDNQINVSRATLFFCIKLFLKFQ